MKRLDLCHYDVTVKIGEELKTYTVESETGFKARQAGLESARSEYPDAKLRWIRTASRPDLINRPSYASRRRDYLQQLMDVGDRYAARELAHRERVRRQELQKAEKIKSKDGRGRNAYRAHLRRAKAIELGLPVSEWTADETRDV